MKWWTQNGWLLTGLNSYCPQETLRMIFSPNFSHQNPRFWDILFQHCLSLRFYEKKRRPGEKFRAKSKGFLHVNNPLLYLNYTPGKNYGKTTQSHGGLLIRWFSGFQFSVIFGVPAMFHFSGLSTSTKKKHKNLRPPKPGLSPIPVQQLARPVPTFTAFGDLVATTVDLRHRRRSELLGTV